jgi:HIV Tat-specific factor 1
MAELRGPRGMAPQNDAPSRIPFPQTPDQFEQDTRVSYSKLDNKWILEDVDGSEWEFEESLGKWMPSVRLSRLRLHYPT